MSAVEADRVDQDLAQWVAARPVGVRSRCSGWRRAAKRALDLAVGTPTLILALPVMTFIAVVVKVTSRGPVVFRQQRVGRDGRHFEMLKFRTMYVDALDRLEDDPSLYQRYVSHDYKLPAEDDPRVVPLGRFLRHTSLDELPQLINVLRGDMSLVGPRPVVESELRNYGPLARSYTSVRPGITGRWQIEGRNRIRYPERARLDAAYVEHYRVRDDLVILWRTIPSVLGRHGVH